MVAVYSGTLGYRSQKRSILSGAASKQTGADNLSQTRPNRCINHEAAQLRLC